MFQIKRADLNFHYNESFIRQKQKKEQTKWMWIVLVACFLLQMLPYCVAVNLNKNFSGQEWLIWTNGNQTFIGLTFTLGTLSASFIAPFIAKLFNKNISLRFIYGVGVVAACFGFGFYGVRMVLPESMRSLPSTVAILWTGNIISQIGLIIFSGLGINNLINKWWPSEKRAFALGIVFAGGSFGNIWMQPMVNEIVDIFGNLQENYVQNGDQYWSYFIMGLFGIVTGLIVVMIACKKPLAPISVFDDIKKQEEVKNNNELSASFLNTKKYPIYWLLFFGFMLIQMAGIHSSNSGLILSKYTLVANGMADDYKDFLWYSGFAFGTACLIGNSLGTMLTDKIKVNRSLFLSGMLQLFALIVMINSIYQPYLYYLYLVLTGFSIYVFTSMPSYVCNKLFGKTYSNSHIAILGIFTGLGFAISNSLTGPLVGNTETIHYVMGKEINGNIMNLFIYVIICLSLGTILVVICSTIILNKGIKGLLEYSPTKYSRIITFKYALLIKLSVLRIKWFKKDFRNNVKRKNKMQLKISKFMHANSYHDCYQLIKNNMKNKLTKSQINLLTYIYYYHTLPPQYALNDLSYLIYQKYISIKNQNCDTSLLDYSLKSLISNDWFFDHTTKCQKQIDAAHAHMDNVIDKLDIKLAYKQKRLNQKLLKIQAINVSSKKQNKLTATANKKINYLDNKLKKLLMNTKLDDWTRFQKQYYYLDLKYRAEALKNKHQNKIDNKKQRLQKKIFIQKYVHDFDVNKQKEGFALLLAYYQNPYMHYDYLIDKQLALINKK